MLIENNTRKLHKILNKIDDIYKHERSAYVTTAQVVTPRTRLQILRDEFKDKLDFKDYDYLIGVFTYEL